MWYARKDDYGSCAFPCDKQGAVDCALGRGWEILFSSATTLSKTVSFHMPQFLQVRGEVALSFSVALELHVFRSRLLPPVILLRWAVGASRPGKDSHFQGPPEALRFAHQNWRQAFSSSCPQALVRKLGKREY